MKIIDVSLKWAKGLSVRKRTDAIVLHHAAGNGGIYDIHNMHIKQNGWIGIGYHFYVRKDGSIYRGRPIEKMGAHAEGFNDSTIGVCFEGNFEKERMSDYQKEAGRFLIAHIRESYGKMLPIKRHSDLSATACPGKHFPFDDIGNVSEDDTVTKMFDDGIISLANVPNWEVFLSGRAKVPGEYVRTIVERYQKKVKE